MVESAILKKKTVYKIFDLMKGPVGNFPSCF